jgi:hypothetical protein
MKFVKYFCEQFADFSNEVDCRLTERLNFGFENDGGGKVVHGSDDIVACLRS